MKGVSDKIYSAIKELDDIEQTEESAINAMNWASYYGDMDLFEEYRALCQERGGCQESEGGIG